MGRQIDENGITTGTAVSSVDSTTLLPLVVDPVTNRLMVSVVPDSIVVTPIVKCKIDENYKETIYGVSDVDGVTLVPIRTDSNGNLLASL